MIQLQLQQQQMRNRPTQWPYAELSSPCFSQPDNQQ
jgi:hypothetical protein